MNNYSLCLQCDEISRLYQSNVENLEIQNNAFR